MTVATPYADAVRRYAARDLQRLNVPGHGADPGAAPFLADFYGEELLRRDIPPLLDGVDKGQHNPLQLAHDEAARAWGARRTWFLTNGASQANRIAALALASFGGPGDAVVAQRSAHSSFIDGMVLGGLRPLFLAPAIDEQFGIAHGVSRGSLAEILRSSGPVKAVYVITPSYFGAVSDVAALAEEAHSARIPLVVDAAWGAHFGFHPGLPANPLALGADLVVSSTHKMGGSLTQSAMLHLAEGPFADALEPLVERAFGLTQSTSASSVLLASLDLARASLETGHDRIANSIARADDLRRALRSGGRFRIVSDYFDSFDDIVADDPLRVSIDVRSGGLHGHAVREELMRTAGIYTEISTDACIVAFIGPGQEPDIDRFVSALNSLRPVGELASRGEAARIALPQPGESRMRPRDAFLAPSEVLPAVQAAGRVSADSLAAYPPGIPNVLPGEVVTAELIAFLQQIAATPGGYVRGAADPLLATIRVVREG
jgi:arginine/lysine/ornithine decarboxylase